jgi:hypothetical protein
MLWVVIQYYLINSFTNIVSVLSIASSFNWLVSLSYIFLHFFPQHFLTFWQYKMLQAYYISSPVITHSSKEPWFLLLENSVRNEDFSITRDRCYWCVITSRLSWLTGQGTTCVFTNRCICLSTNISTCNHLSLY